MQEKVEGVLGPMRKPLFHINKVNCVRMTGIRRKSIKNRSTSALLLCSRFEQKGEKIEKHGKNGENLVFFFQKQRLRTEKGFRSVIFLTDGETKKEQKNSGKRLAPHEHQRRVVGDRFAIMVKRNCWQDFFECGKCRKLTCFRAKKCSARHYSPGKRMKKNFLSVSREKNGKGRTSSLPAIRLS